MADKGIIIDVGFRGEYKKFIDEIEREFSNIDFGKSLGMDKAFEEQEKKIRERLKDLKKLMDEVLAGNPSDVPKQLGQLQSSVLHLSKAVKEMMQNADPSDVKKFGSSISTITDDINELATSCQNAQEVISDLGKNHPVKLVDEGQKKALIDQYRALKNIDKELEKRDKILYNGKNKKRYNESSDITDRIPDDMQKAIKGYNNLNKQIQEINNDTTIAAEDKVKQLDVLIGEAVKHIIQFKRLYASAADLTGSSKKADDIIPFYESKNQYKVSAWMENSEAYLNSYLDYINDRKEKIADAYRELTSLKIEDYIEVEEPKKEVLVGKDIDDYFKKSESKRDIIKFPVALADGAKKTLTKQATDLIDDLCKELANHPIEIEVVPVSDWANRQTQTKLNNLIKRVGELKNSPLSESLATDIRSYFEEWEKNIDNRFLFNVEFQTKEANEQLKEFIKNAQEELNILNSLEIKPDVVITEPVKEHVKTEIEELGKGLNLKPTINIAPEVIEEIKKGVTEETEKVEEKAKKTKDITEKRKHETESQYKSRMQALAILKGEVLLQDDEVKKVNNVIDAIDKKTDAFITERDLTILATQDEINVLSLLFDKVNSIRDAVLEINIALAGLPKEIELHLNLEGLNAESAQILDKVNQVRGDILHKTVEKYGESTQLSEEDKTTLLKDISDLTEKMGGIFDTNPIMTWENDFEFASNNVKEYIGGIFNTFQEGFDNIKIQINEISESFKSILGDKNPVSDELTRIVEDWIKADKRQALTFKNDLTHNSLSERQTGFNDKTGYIHKESAYHLIGANGQSPYAPWIISDSKGQVNSLIHSHHEAFPSISKGDIKNSYNKVLDGIESDFIAGIYQVQKFKTKEFIEKYGKLFDTDEKRIAFYQRMDEEKYSRTSDFKNYATSDYFRDMFNNLDYKTIFPELKDLSVDKIVDELKDFTSKLTDGTDDLSGMLKEDIASAYLQGYLLSKKVQNTDDLKLLTNPKNISRNAFTLKLRELMPEMIEKVSTDMGVPIKDFGSYIEKMTVSEFKERYSNIKSNKTGISSLFNSDSLNEFKITIEQILADIREIVSIIPENGINFNISGTTPANEVDIIKSELLERRKILENELRELENTTDLIDEAEQSVHNLSSILFKDMKFNNLNSSDYREKSFAGNIDTGYVTSVRKGLNSGTPIELIKEAFNEAEQMGEEINSFFHSHTQEITAAFSFDDLLKAADIMESNSKIVNQFAYSLNDIAHLDLSGLSPEKIREIGNKFRDLAYEKVGNEYVVDEDKAINNQLMSALEDSMTRISNIVTNSIDTIDSSDFSSKLSSNYRKEIFTGASDSIAEIFENAFKNTATSFGIKPKALEEIYNKFIDYTLATFQESILNSIIKEAVPNIDVSSILKKYTLDEFTSHINGRSFIDEAEQFPGGKKSSNIKNRIKAINDELNEIDIKLAQIDSYGEEVQEDLDFSRTTEGIDEAINSLDDLNTKFEEILETINLLTEALRDNLSEMSDYGKVFPLDDLANAFYEYKKFFDADDLNSEAGAKAALKYLSAYKNALYSKVNKKDIKEYTIGGTDKYFTGNYKKYSGKNGSIKDLDLSGIESEIAKYKQVLLESTGIPTLLDSFREELQGMFSLPENAGELPEFLNTIKSSLTMPEGSNTVSDALNTLKKSLDSLTNSKVDDKITKLFETLDKIIEGIQSLSGTQELPFIQNLNDILSKKNELKDLVKILESSAKQINAAKKNVKSEENYKKATELLSDNRQGIINAVMDEIGLPLDSDDLLGSEMKALKNGLVEVNTLIREADGTATQYTFTVDENLKAVNTKINDNVVDLKKYIDAIEKAEKEANIGKNNLGSYYEAFTPDSKGWDQLVDRIEKAGHKLESVDKIIRHIDEAGQESFQVFSGDTRVTVGMDSQQPLYRKDTVMDAAGALDTYKREIVDLKRVAEKAFAGDQVAIEGFISKYNELIGLYKTIEGYKAKGIISDDSFAEIESLFSSLKEKVLTFKDALNFDKQMPEIQKQAEDIGKWFDKIIEKFNISSNGIDKDEFKEFIGQFTGILGTKNDSNIKAGNANKLTVLLTRITEDMKQNSNMSNELRTDYERLERTIQSFNGVATDAQIKDLNAQFLALHYNLVQTGKSGKKFIDTVAQRLSDMNAKWIAQLFSIHDWVNYIRSTANAIIELDTALVDLKKTTTMTSEELDQFYFDANKIAKQMGVTTAEIISQASAWSRFNKIDLLYGNV